MGTCDEQRQVFAFGAEEPGSPVALTACIASVGGGPLPIRVDRTGQDLCGPESVETPCPGDDCMHECFANSDCAAGRACLCAAALDDLPEPGSWLGVYNWASRCVPAECESDADCGGYGCGFSRELCTPGVSPESPGFYCRTADDECRTDTDCGPQTPCVYDATVGHWICGVGGPCE